jgi:hypothetical protein
MKKLVILGTLVVGMACVNAFAQSGSGSIPGIISGKGSAGSEITDSKLTVMNNKATRVTAGGGKAGIKIGEISLDGIANVNSINVTGSKVKNSELLIMGNEATDINAIGGTANVNSININ